jgi:radical SAM/Cys-rich protein
VDAGPDRTEVMSQETMAACLRVLDRTAIPTVDITGGAPELNPHFRWLVEEIAARGRHIIDRCNLTILTTAAQGHLPAFFAAHRVEVIVSLPHYRALNTDAQRGEGVYEKSIAALKTLNAVGYGEPGSGLRLVPSPTRPARSSRRARRHSKRSGSASDCVCGHPLRCALLPDQHADQPVPRLARGIGTP